MEEMGGKKGCGVEVILGWGRGGIHGVRWGTELGWLGGERAQLWAFI